MVMFDKSAPDWTDNYVRAPLTSPDFYRMVQRTKDRTLFEYINVVIAAILKPSVLQLCSLNFW